MEHHDEDAGAVADMNLLPPEVVVIIMSNLDRLSLVCVRFVCRGWDLLLRDMVRLQHRRLAKEEEEVLFATQPALAEPEPHFKAPKDFMQAVAYAGWLSVLQWARANGCGWDAQTFASAAAGGHLEVLAWLHAQGCPNRPDLMCFIAAKRGRLQVLRWAEGTAGYKLDRSPHMMRLAAASGSIELVEWLAKTGCQWDASACAAAAGGGHLDLLRWLWSCGCPWSPATCAAAAEGNHLEVLQWARRHGCRWNGNTTDRAARAGHIRLLRWAVEEGCRVSTMTCVAAAEGGRVDSLVWLQEQGVLMHTTTIGDAAIPGKHIDVLVWLSVNGYPLSPQARRVLSDGGLDLRRDFLGIRT